MNILIKSREACSQNATSMKYLKLYEMLLKVIWLRVTMFVK